LLAAKPPRTLRVRKMSIVSGETGVSPVHHSAGFDIQ
jgi:hypothetical protein